MAAEAVDTKMEVQRLHDEEAAPIYDDDEGAPDSREKFPPSEYAIPNLLFRCGCFHGIFGLQTHGQRSVRWPW